jgi:signal transduction histidine kinase
MKISHWGVTPEMNPQFAKRIILTNLLGFTFALNMLVSLLAFLYLKLWVLVPITIVFVLTELAWPFLNRLGYFTISRLGLLITSNILGFIVSVLLPGTGYNRGFYVMVVLPFLLFSFVERKSLFLGIVLPLFLYPLSEHIQYLTPVSELGIVLAMDITQFIANWIGVIYVGLITLAFYFFAKENDRVLQILEEQRARSFSSAKFAALGEMASGIAHEINNPLMAINMNNENLKYMLKENSFSHDEASKLVSSTSKTISRAANIIHSMRNFSREASLDEFQVESIQRIIDETLVFCKERFQNHGVNLKIEAPENERLIHCRPVQISQVLLNLLNNAFDAVEEQEKKWIRIEVSDHNVNGLEVSVIDSGNGIPKHYSEKIFEPFFTTKPPGKGTGLGLSLSKQIAKEHQGELFLMPSSVHTRFCFWLPEKLISSSP